MPAVRREAVQDPLQVVAAHGHEPRPGVDGDGAVRLRVQREVRRRPVADAHRGLRQPAYSAAVAPVNENDDSRSDGTTLAPRNPRRQRRSRLTASTFASASR